MAENALFSGLSAEELAQIKKHLIRDNQFKMLKKWMPTGLAAGVGLGGAAVLAKAIGGAASPFSTSYTHPVETVVYKPDREEQKAKTKRSKKAAAFGASELDKLTHQDLLTPTIMTAGGFGMIPVGFMLANYLNQKTKQVMNKQELSAAQREFETALQEYAEAGDEPKKLKAKRAAMDERQEKISRLAENCHLLSKKAMLNNLAQSYMAWLLLSPLVAGAYGFKDRWDHRKYKDLQIAERQLNLQREKLNPTFTVAKLKTPPDLDKEPVDEQEAEAQRNEIRMALQEAVDSYQTDYL